MEVFFFSGLKISAHRTSAVWGLYWVGTSHLFFSIKESLPVFAVVYHMGMESGVARVSFRWVRVCQQVSPCNTLVRTAAALVYHASSAGWSLRTRNNLPPPKQCGHRHVRRGGVDRASGDYLRAPSPRPRFSGTPAPPPPPPPGAPQTCCLGATPSSNRPAPCR